MSAGTHPWLGPVTEGTRVGRLKHAIDEMSSGGTPESGNAAFWANDGGTPWVAISDMSGTERVHSTSKAVTSAGITDKRLRVLPPGTLLYSMYASLGHVAELAIPAATNQAILGLSFNECVNRRYAFWQLKALQPYVVEAASSNTQDNLNAEKVRNLPFAFPPRDEQERIASFLDEQTARIDALIAEKERLIVLLSEQRLSIAERVMADSATGTTAKLGFHADFLAGYAFPSDEFSRDESDIPLLRGVNVAPASIRWDDVVYWRRDYDASLERFRLQAGDVVFGMDRPWISSGARVAMVDADSAGAFLLQRVCRLRGGPKMRQRFLFYALASDAFRQSLEVDLTGVSVPHISPEQVLGFKVPVLTPEEQDVRCADADRQTEALQGLAMLTDGLLRRLREYRSSLISAAVTGQLDLSTFKDVQ